MSFGVFMMIQSIAAGFMPGQGNIPPRSISSFRALIMLSREGVETPPVHEPIPTWFIPWVVGVAAGENEVPGRPFLDQEHFRSRGVQLRLDLSRTLAGAHRLSSDAQDLWTGSGRNAQGVPSRMILDGHRVGPRCSAGREGTPGAT